MDSGKSTFLYNFVLNMKKLTSIGDERIKIIFCHDSNNSVEPMREASFEIGATFQAQKYLPDLEYLESEQAETQNRQSLVLILEVRSQY